MAQNHDGEPVPDAFQTERILVFRLEDGLHGLRVNDISGIASCEVLRELPGAPAGVRGLAEWRGSVLTVLDLPCDWGRVEQDEPACLIRLAPPLEQTALYVPATVQLTENRFEVHAEETETGTRSGWLCNGEPITLLDPTEIVCRLEAEMRESS